MNIQLIMMLPQPILVSYEPDVRDTFPYHVAEKLTTGEWTIWQVDNFNDIDERNQKKIIAGIPNLPSVNLSALSEKECKVIGWIDLEKLARDAVSASNSVDVKLVREVWKNGFKTAQSLNEKKFTLSDLKSAFSYYAFTSTSQQPYSDKELDEAFEKFASVLSRPKVFDVEIETEWYKDLPPGGGFGGAAPIDLEWPKITNNSIKVLRLL